MINYQSRNPSNGFTMLEDEALFGLSADAYYLYAILRNLDKDADNSIEALVKRTRLTKNGLRVAKTELKKEGWIASKQLYGNIYALYIGKEAVRKYNYFEKKKKQNSI